LKLCAAGAVQDAEPSSATGWHASPDGQSSIHRVQGWEYEQIITQEPVAMLK
jgi:hypothetical protein